MPTVVGLFLRIPDHARGPPYWPSHVPKCVMAAHLATTPLAFSAQPTWPLIVPWRRVRISWALPVALACASLDPARPKSHKVGALPLLTMSRLLLCAGAAASGCHCRRFAPHLFVLDPGERAGLRRGLARCGRSPRTELVARGMDYQGCEPARGERTTTNRRVRASSGSGAQVPGAMCSPPRRSDCARSRA